MSRDAKIAIGVTFIIIGLLWTFSSFGVRIIDWNSFWHAFSAMWPLVFVVAGLNMIIDSPTVNTILWLVLVALVFLLAIYYTQYGYSGYFYDDIYRFFFR